MEPWSQMQPAVFPALLVRQPHDVFSVSVTAERPASLSLIEKKVPTRVLSFLGFAASHLTTSADSFSLVLAGNRFQMWHSWVERTLQDFRHEPFTYKSESPIQFGAGWLTLHTCSLQAGRRGLCSQVQLDELIAYSRRCQHTQVRKQQGDQGWGSIVDPRVFLFEVLPSLHRLESVCLVLRREELALVGLALYPGSLLLRL